MKLDRTLTFRPHLESLRKKLTFRGGFLKRSAESNWGADATVLCTATLALVHFTAEHCAPVWCCSAHSRIVDKPINDALRIVTGCLRPIPTDNLFILSAIQPTELRNRKIILFSDLRIQEPEHLVYEKLLSTLGGQLQQLKSRHPFVPAALELLSDFAQSGTSIA